MRERIHGAARVAGREPSSVALLAVSKTQPAERIAALFQLGQRSFGENYLQEAAGKIAELKFLPIDWHFIGPIQSNKTRPIAESFSWVHGVDRLKIAERLSAQRPEALPPLNICIQVNVSGEASKSGVSPDAVGELVAAAAALPHLRVRGLMALPAPELSEHQQRAGFRRLRELRDACAGVALDTLSMGMSDDLEAAIAEGATWVRIGTALFGPRPRPAE